MSVFSDQRVIDFIRTNFVPVTTDTNKTILRRDAVGDFFRKIAEQGHFAGRTKPTATRQGLYVSMADGQLLASISSNNADDVLKMMKRAVVKFEKIKHKSQPKIGDQFKSDPEYSAAFPTGGMILRVTCRDLPRQLNARHETWRHNFDNLWLTAQEVKSFSPSNKRGNFKVGQKYEIPSALIARIAKFHLLDYVQGEAPAWQPKSVKIAKATAKVIEITSDEIKIELRGRVKCVQQSDKRANPYTGAASNKESGVDLRLAGRMTWKIGQAAFTRFDCVAYGDRWGAATYNFRHKDLEKNPIGFTLNLLPTTAENMTQPKFIQYNYYQ